uniref:DB domain-containing protein n=1 Tax=Loa loa TaxID=7209 RepID=A0A1I7VL31_LOALO
MEQHGKSREKCRSRQEHEFKYQTYISLTQRLVVATDEKVTTSGRETSTQPQISIHTLTILLFGIQYDVYASIPTTDEVVARCCSKEYAECCTESVDFAKPLRCNGMMLGTRIDVTQCIQKKMYGEHHPMLLNLTDALCCDVFADDDNDEKGHCLTECITVMQIPALRNDKKLKRIKGCRRTNQLYKCFTRCLQWLHNKTEDEVLDFEQECSIKLKMLPGKVYIGPEIK